MASTYDELLAAKSDGVAERLYILKGGVGHAGDANSWANMMFPPGTPVDIAANSHLIKHEKGWMLFDCSTNDSISKMPNGFGAAANGIRWTKGADETIEPQLAKIGITPADIRYIALSHEHADHSGNVHMFPNAIAIMQRREHEHAFHNGAAPAGPPSFQGAIFPRHYPVMLLDGDYDVFGDGSVVLYYVGGHTVGSQVCIVRLKNSGSIMLTGDAVHLQSNWDTRRTPRLQSANDENQWHLTVWLAYQRMAELQEFYKSQMWIHHDMDGYKNRQFAPDFYD
jgi:glyoxylase-like metal-dependent hydrolase (beta-lactamase superfamily II)